MSKQFGVQCGYFSGVIHAGTLNKKQTEFTHKEDVTADALHAVADWAEKNHQGSAWVTLGDGRRMEIDVTTQEEDTDE